MLALISLPSAVRSGSLIIMIQNALGAASDKRAQSTFEDTEALLHINHQIQKHMAAQDEAIVAIMAHLGLATSTR